MGRTGWGRTKERLPEAPLNAGVGCWWSPTGDHLFQLVELDADDRPGYVLADRCSYCGGLAFAVPGQRSGADDGLGRPGWGNHD
jgi:hypothetical protein